MRETRGDPVLIAESVCPENVESYLRRQGLFDVVNSPGVYNVESPETARVRLLGTGSFRRSDGTLVDEPEWDDVELVAYTTDVLG
ncbi:MULTISPECIES: hypothetical protein [Haloarcula]|uniref:hypothetical protein n=1 Tax=Haloarcula TaxID=2237 RepID=UPI0023E7E0E5|nr:hypothetical protein [Halomicroarcula sp. SHR3]